MEYKQLSLKLIEEGALESDFEDAFFELQNKMMLHVAKHGEASKKAKGKIMLEITLEVMDHENGVTMGTTSKIKSTLPSRPEKKTIVVGDETSEGKPSLACRAWGSTFDSPHQGIMNFPAEEALDDEQF